jgi:hypothetical protein
MMANYEETGRGFESVEVAWCSFIGWWWLGQEHVLHDVYPASKSSKSINGPSCSIQVALSLHRSIAVV